jgi:hypothetical protein
MNRFSGRALSDVLATHSHVILNERIQKNPHYTEPMVFLKRLIRRHPTAMIRTALDSTQ